MDRRLIDEDTQVEVLFWHQEGEKPGAIAERVGISRTTVRRIIDRGCIQRETARPRPTQREERGIYRPSQKRIARLCAEIRQRSPRPMVGETSEPWILPTIRLEDLGLEEDDGQLLL